MLVSDFSMYLANQDGITWPTETYWMAVEEVLTGGYSPREKIEWAMLWVQETKGTENEDAAKHFYRFLRAQQRLLEVQDRAREARRARERTRNRAQVRNRLGDRLREAGLRA